MIDEIRVFRQIYAQQRVIDLNYQIGSMQASFINNPVVSQAWMSRYFRLIDRRDRAVAKLKRLERDHGAI